MKMKPLALALALAGLSVAACQKDAPAPPAAPTEATAPTAAPPTTPAEPVAAPAEPAAPAPLTEADATARGQAALKPLKQGLMKALQEALAAGPPEGAITVCRDQAPAIAAAASKDGVTVGRTSDKLRNPANAPRPWLAPLLAEYAGKKQGEAPAQRVVALEDGRFGYAEPIFTAPLCATCHGTSVGSDVGAKLAELYPGDQARGYAEGDFRGLFWAEVAPATR